MEEFERRSLLRILDANSNRASEALRVAEDVCRFHWNLPGFASDLKALRHEVLDAVAPGLAERRELLESRDIRGDVGREAPSPGRAVDVKTMAVRNLQRAREALRVLEEACRIERPERAARLEKARYTLYAIEKGLAHLPPLGGAAGRIAAAQICLLATARLATRPLEEVVAAAVDAGVDVVQLREKGPSDREILRSARALREITARRGVLFIVNDRPDIALRAGADGAHLGQDDLPLAEARALVGKTMLLGVSTHSVSQALAAEREGADYIGVGPMFPTLTKEAGPLLGPSGLRDVLAAVHLPAFAIGGINRSNAHSIGEAGGTRVAVSSAILAASDIAAEVAALRAALGGKELVNRELETGNEEWKGA